VNDATPAFDADTLAAFDREAEVDIETVGPSGATRRATIWIVVVGGLVYIRSWRGDQGRWYQDVGREPRSAIHVDGRRVPVIARPATEPADVARCSRALEQKYAGDPSTPSMVRREVLHTTLRLMPA
jgi:hypothetical protein